VRGVVLAFCIAAAAFALIFRGIGFHFWFQMALTVSVLCLMASLINPVVIRNLFSSRLDAMRAIVLGLFSAAVLYGVFLAGGNIAAWLFPSAGSQVNSVYALKTGTEAWLITLLLVGVIGPGEEVFWRGYFQKQLEDRYGFLGVILAAGAYAMVHLPSGNPMLVIAAAVCGGFWGLMFYYWRSIWMNMVSHAAWDLAIFIIWPVYC